jgi:bifunctional DNA-binding transcriptional regulator/antitoxin component of YhaV-PrlF toxin-antitoxin module
MAETYSADLKVAKSGRITLPSETREIGNINVGDFVHITFRKIVKEEGKRND